MRAVDRLLQRWRIRKAARYIPRGARVLDVGCFDGTLFRLLGGRIAGGLGIDPLAPEGTLREGVRLVRGAFPDDMPADAGSFDAITAIAVVEHVPSEAAAGFARACARYLAPGGRLVLTVPSAGVDAIVRMLQRVRMADGMSLEQHHGLTAAGAVELFTAHGFQLVRRARFQLGFNNLLVFRKGPQ